MILGILISLGSTCAVVSVSHHFGNAPPAPWSCPHKLQLLVPIKPLHSAAVRRTKEDPNPSFTKPVVHPVQGSWWIFHHYETKRSCRKGQFSCNQENFSKLRTCQNLKGCFAVKLNPKQHCTPLRFVVQLFPTNWMTALSGLTWERATVATSQAPATVPSCASDRLKVLVAPSLHRFSLMLLAREQSCCKPLKQQPSNNLGERCCCGPGENDETLQQSLSSIGL